MFLRKYFKIPSKSNKKEHPPVNGNKGDQHTVKECGLGARPQIEKYKGQHSGIVRYQPQAHTGNNASLNI